MKHLILFVALLFFMACGKASYNSYRSSPSEMPAPEREQKLAYNASGGGGGGARQAVPAEEARVLGGVAGDIDGKLNQAKLLKASENSPSNQEQAPIERKIIRNGELDLEMEKPAEIANQISSLANSLGGFVVTSESQQIGANGVRMSVVVRVPASKFDQAMKDIRALVGNGRVLREKATGLDVTEEFVDLQARLRAKVALENQFLEILKKAIKVSDMLEVQNSLNAVRTEIEQIEGRLRFLENQASLSTITLSLQTPQPLVTQSSRGFFSEFKAAISDGIEISQSIVFGLIRLMGVLVPVVVFLGTPLYIVFRVIRSRMRRQNANRVPPEK
ncbi:MAG: DUF4349 domain-containing protein [Acidobacteria bacterium]|nr:DUF4349 domain-containing protein [Acidobacteriota bacterium]